VNAAVAGANRMRIAQMALKASGDADFASLTTAVERAAQGSRARAVRSPPPANCGQIAVKRGFRTRATSLVQRKKSRICRTYWGVLGRTRTCDLLIRSKAFPASVKSRRVPFGPV